MDHNVRDWATDRLFRRSVEEFADTLNSVYGDFSVAENEFGAHGATWSRNAGVLLSSAEVTVAGLEVARQKNALKSEHRNVVFILLQLDGQQTIEHCDNRNLLLPGDVAFVSHKHAIRLNSHAPNRVLAAHLPLDVVRSPDIPRSLYGRRFSGKSLRTQMFSDIILRLARPPATHDADPGDYELNLLTVAWSGMALDDAPRGRTTSFDRVEDFVRANLDKPDLDVQSLCRELGVSPRTLYRRCQEQGLTPSAWLWRMRLDVARDRLRSPAWRNHSITDISQSVGFTDLSHFSRSFKRAFGISPKTWSNG